MKRHSAGNDTDMRKRTDAEVARPFGPLTEEEIEDLRQAYRDGCRGEVIIGLRGDERVITMLVPEQSSRETADTLVQRLSKKLKEMGCKRLVRIRRTSDEPEQPAVPRV